MDFTQLRPGLKHTRTIAVSEAMAVPAASLPFQPTTDMPPVFATACMIAFVEWTCVEALAPYVAPHQRTVGTHVDISHSAATPIGMQVTAEIELIAIDRRTLRFKVACRDEADVIGEGFHERTLIDHGRFMERLDKKRGAG